MIMIHTDRQTYIHIKSYENAENTYKNQINTNKSAVLRCVKRTASHNTTKQGHRPGARKEPSGGRPATTTTSSTYYYYCSYIKHKLIQNVLRGHFNMRGPP